MARVRVRKRERERDQLRRVKIQRTSILFLLHFGLAAHLNAWRPRRAAQSPPTPSIYSAGRWDDWLRRRQPRNGAKQAEREFLTHIKQTSLPTRLGSAWLERLS